MTRLEERRENWGGGEPTFTAEQLICILRRVPGETPVCVPEPLPGGWYLNIESVIWDPDDAGPALMFWTADDFDTRQFFPPGVGL